MHKLSCATLGAFLLGLPCIPAAQEAEEPAPAPEFVERITTTATRSARPVFTTPAAVSVRSGLELEREQPSTYADVFEGMPGVSIQGAGRRIAERPNIRGFDDDQVVLRVDGARQNFNLIHRGRFFTDPDLLERVEVFRGSGSSLYGSGALGGVISLATKSAPSLLREGERLGGRYRIGYQSNGRETLHSLGAFGRGGRFDGMVNFAWREGREDLQDGDGQDILATEDEVLHRLVKLGLTPSENQRLEFTSDSYRNEGVNPPNANAVATFGPRGNVVDRDTTWRSQRLSYRYRDPDGGLLDLLASLYRNEADVEENRFSDGRQDTSDFTTRGFDLQNTARFELGPTADLSLTLGGEIYQDRQKGKRGDEGLQGATRANVFPRAQVSYRSGFLQSEVTLWERLSIIPGVRYDSYEVENKTEPDQGRDQTELSPKLSLGYRANDQFYLWGSASKAFRAPGLTTLYADGVHYQRPVFDPRNGCTFGSRGPTCVLTNEFQPAPDLAAETARSLEAGFRWRREGVFSDGDRLHLEGTYYDTQIDDYVAQDVWENLDRFFQPSPFSPRLYSGATASASVDARMRGFEALVRYQAQNLTVTLSGFSLDAENRDTGKGLASAPADALSASLVGRLPAWGLELGARATLTREQDDVPEGSMETDSYQVVDVFLSWTPGWAALEDLRFVMSLNNAFDEDYSIHPTPLKRPGRSLRLSASYQFGI